MKAKSVLQILLLSAVWGVSFLMIRIAGDSFPPLWVALLRCSLGAALLWTVLKIGGSQLPPRRLLPWLLTVALLNNAMPFTFFAWGERTVPSNIAAVINATTPIWTLLSMPIHRTRAALLTIGGVLLGFGGVLVVAVSHASDPAADHVSGGLLRGTIVIALAALGYAVATVMAKAKLQGLDPIGLATTQLSLAGLIAPTRCACRSSPVRTAAGSGAGHRGSWLCRERVCLPALLSPALAGLGHACRRSDVSASHLGSLLGPIRT